MRARRRFIALAVIALFLGGVSICSAVVPQPFLLKAKLTVDGSTISGVQPAYQIKITNTSGTDFAPVDTAGDTFGEAVSGRFSYNVPMYDATDQSGGAQAAATACIQLWQGGSQLTVSYPARGACPSGSGAFTVGSPGESIAFGTGLGSSNTYQFDTPITVTTPGNIQVNPTNNAYAATKTGASSSAQTFTVTNTGGTGFTIGTLSLSGTNANQFTKSNDNCSGQPVAGGASCTVDVTFSPTTTGAKTATLNIPSDAPNNTNLTVSLTGTGIEADIGVSPQSKDYGAVNVGATSSQTFTVTNSGTASLAIATAAIAGTNSSEFILGTDTCSGHSIAASGGQCTIQVTFTPATAGAKSATLSIPSDDPDSPGLSVTLSGSVASQNLSVSPSTKAFGDVNAGSASGAQTFTITNTGNVSLVIDAISLSGANSSEFAKSNDTCNGATVTPGGTCSLDVVFSPTSSGPKSATLSIPSNDPDGTSDIALTGTGLANNISVSPPSSINFNSVVIGGHPTSDITVTNNGNADLTISHVAVSGSAFSLTATINDGTVITAGNHATITVRFTSSSSSPPETLSGTVTITSDAHNQTSYPVSLSGTSVAAPVAHLSISPSGTLNFGNNDTGQTADDTTSTLTLTSDGDINLVIGTVVLSDETNYTKTSDTCSGAIVAPAATCTVVVKFNPATVGTKAATITIPSNNGNIDATVDQSSTVSLTGTGIQYGLTVSPSSLDFGSVLLNADSTYASASGADAGCANNGDGTVSCTVTLQNTGTQALTGFTLSAGGQFSVTPTSIASLAASASTTASATYTAAASSSVHTGTLTITSGSFTRTVTLTAMTNTKPETPVATSPADGATDVALSPTLTAGAFSDDDGDSHASSTWQVASASGFAASSIVYQSTNDTTNLTSLIVPPGELQQNMTYYWRVAYKDSRGASSTASAYRSFTTAAATMADSTGVTADATTVKPAGGSEITTLSTGTLPSSLANVSPQLLHDYSAVNCGTGTDTSNPSVAIVKAKGGIDKDVLGITTPAGTTIAQVNTTTTSTFTQAPPTTFTFPYGVVSFRITGVTIGDTVPVTIYTPADLPSNAVWYKYNAAYGWLSIDATGVRTAAGTLLSSNTTFTVVSGKGVLSIKDDDVADVSTEVISGKAVIVDPGAPGIPVPASSAPAALSGGGGGGGCFIATAAFGSYFDPYVMILRNFRDAFLVTNRAGRAFVGWYYRVSPPVADYIATSSMLKAGVRLLLLPAVGFSALALTIGPVVTFMLFLALMLLAVVLS